MPVVQDSIHAYKGILKSPGHELEIVQGDAALSKRLLPVAH